MAKFEEKVHAAIFEVAAQVPSGGTMAGWTCPKCNRKNKGKNKRCTTERPNGPRCSGKRPAIDD